MVKLGIQSYTHKSIASHSPNITLLLFSEDKSTMCSTCFPNTLLQKTMQNVGIITESSCKPLLDSLICCPVMEMTMPCL